MASLFDPFTLKGATFTEVQFELYWLCGILALLVMLASTRFSKKLG